jgi:hypothetical protein
MIDGKYAIFFAEDFDKIPQVAQERYHLYSVDLYPWNNIPEIESDVRNAGYTWGVEVPTLPGEGRRVTSLGQRLKPMKDHD